MAASARELALVKLRASGLDADDARAFGIEFTAREATAALSPTFSALAALKLNYHRPSGALTKFYRVRYLETVNGFDALVKKPMRYVQPPGTTSEVYWPRSAAWAKIAGDPAVPVHLTEGELKACCAVKHGYPTIAVGGVWSWRSAKRGEGVTPTLTPSGFTWQERTVYVVFDSDVAVKPDVAAARLALCETLTALGARPALVTLPTGAADGGKTGLDDFLVAYGKAAYDDALVDAEPFQHARDLWRMNSEAVYVKVPGLVVVMGDGRRLAPHAFVNHAYSNRHYFVQQIMKDGSTKLVKKPLAKAWLEWELRAELNALTYAPGEARVTDDGKYNLWEGWGCAPVKGDVSPWRELLDFLFKNDLPARAWFERWCAYPLQRPGVKLYTCAVIWGIVQGTGKSLIGYSLGKIYGRNFAEIGEEQLHSQFNEWAESKQFVMGDDVTSGEKRARSFLAEKLKNLITQQQLRINAKFVPEFTVPDCVNYYFTANQPDSFIIEDTDRRNFVHEVVGPPLPAAFYQRYNRWLHSAEGPSALYHYLRAIDLGDFDPKAPAPWTMAKRLMSVDNKSDLGAWAARLKEAPGQVLRAGDAELSGDLFTASELLLLYDPERRGRVTANGLGRELKRAGFRYVNDGKTVTTRHGSQRLYAVRNCERWLAARAVDCAAEYDRRFTPDKATVKKKEKF